MNTIVLASRNKHKIKELRETMDGLNIELESALDFPALQEVEEDRRTLEGNAVKKARYVHGETGLPALADDTGLEVEALDGRPGVFSARYAGEMSTYEDNVKKLLDELAGVRQKDRKAQFRTVMAFVSDEGVHTFEGICRGEIITGQKGDGGFGYDPVFKPEDYDQTFAELDPAEKNKISHRGKAMVKFVKWLRGQVD